MMMCHMVADTREELDAMADREHYDICKSERAIAVAFGAQEISSEWMVFFRREQPSARNNREA